MAARALTRRYDRALKPHDLNLSQFSVLVAAAIGEGRLTVTALAEILGLERSGLRRNPGALERRRLVRLGPEGRHRTREAHLTEAGRALLDVSKASWKKAQAEAEAALGEEAAELRRGLQQLTQIE